MCQFANVGNTETGKTGFKGTRSPSLEISTLLLVMTRGSFDRTSKIFKFHYVFFDNNNNVFFSYSSVSRRRNYEIFPALKPVNPCQPVQHAICPQQFYFVNRKLPGIKPETVKSQSI